MLWGSPLSWGPSVATCDCSEQQDSCSLVCLCLIWCGISGYLLLGTSNTDNWLLKHLELFRSEWKFSAVIEIVYMPMFMNSGANLQTPEQAATIYKLQTLEYPIIEKWGRQRLKMWHFWSFVCFHLRHFYTTQCYHVCGPFSILIIPEFVSQAEVGNKECLQKPNCKCAARGNGPRASRAETETGGCKNVGKISLPPDLLELIPGLVTAKQWAEGDCRGARELGVYVSEQNAKNFPGSEYRVFLSHLCLVQSPAWRRSVQDLVSRLLLGRYFIRWSPHKILIFDHHHSLKSHTWGT